MIKRMRPKLAMRFSLDMDSLGEMASSAPGSRGFASHEGTEEDATDDFYDDAWLAECGEWVMSRVLLNGYEFMTGDGLIRDGR